MDYSSLSMIVVAAKGELKKRKRIKELSHHAFCFLQETGAVGEGYGTGTGGTTVYDEQRGATAATTTTTTAAASPGGVEGRTGDHNGKVCNEEYFSKDGRPPSCP